MCPTWIHRCRLRYVFVGIIAVVKRIFLHSSKAGVPRMLWAFLIRFNFINHLAEASAVMAALVGVCFTEITLLRVWDWLFILVVTEATFLVFLLP